MCVLYFPVEHFKSHILAFSSNLEAFNPGVAEWRQDISRVVKDSMVQVSSPVQYYYRTSYQ